MEDRLRESKNSDNSRRLKTISHATVKLAATSPSLIPGYKIYTAQTKELWDILPMTKETEFWLASVTTFGNLSEVNFTSVYSKKEIAKITLERAMR